MNLLRFTPTFPRDPAIDPWFTRHPPALATIARHWFAVMRTCGDEVRELFHDGCPTACLGEYPFAYVAIFTAHVNVGFFQGASLPDPAHLLLGTGKRMRHLKLTPGSSLNAPAIDPSHPRRLLRHQEAPRNLTPSLPFLTKPHPPPITPACVSTPTSPGTRKA